MKGELRRYKKLNILFLSGNEREVARLHARFLNNQLSTGMLPFMHSFLKDSVKGLDLTAGKLVGLGIEGIADFIGSHMPEESISAFVEIGRAIGLSKRDIKVILGTPDTLLYLLGMGEKVLRSLPVLFRLAGCSQFVVLPGARNNNGLIHGRNLDYDGIGYWDIHPLISFIKPDKGIPYGYISSAGVHTAGLTGFNAEGLFVAVNTAPTFDCCLRGRPVFAVVEQVVRNAKTVEDAIKILQKDHIASGYNIVISNWMENKAVIVEKSCTKQVVRYPQDGILWATNHFVERNKTEKMPLHTLIDHHNTLMRYRSIGEALNQDIELNRISALNILRSTKDPLDGQIHPIGDVVQNYLNISSVLLDGEYGIIYAGYDTAPVASGRFAGFDIQKGLDGEIDPCCFIQSAGNIPSCISYYQTAHRAVHRGRWTDALKALTMAGEKCPGEGHIYITAALISLKLNQPSHAMRWAQKAIEVLGEDHPRTYRAYLITSWTYSMRGEQKLAREAFDKAKLSVQNEQGEFEMKMWKKLGFNIKRLHIDMFNARALLF